MAHYLIFIEGVRGCDPKCLIPVGLGGLLREGDPTPEMIDCPRGPDGKMGVLLTWRIGDQTRDPKFGIHDRQEWTPALKLNDPELGELPAERYWIGVDLDNPPQPRDLARNNAIPGSTVTLADGFSWMMPTLSRLPNRYRLDSDGDLIQVVEEKYRRFHDTGMRVISSLVEEFNLIEEVRDRLDNIEDHAIPVELKDGMRLVATALALNYRITWELAFILGLLDDHSGAMALMAFCEFTEIHQATEGKKKLKPILIQVRSYSEA